MSYIDDIGRKLKTESGTRSNKGKRAQTEGAAESTRECRTAGKLLCLPFHTPQLLPLILYLILCRTMWKI